MHFSIQTWIAHYNFPCFPVKNMKQEILISKAKSQEEGANETAAKEEGRIITAAWNFQVKIWIRKYKFEDLEEDANETAAKDIVITTGIKPRS